MPELAKSSEACMPAIPAPTIIAAPIFLSFSTRLSLGLPVKTKCIQDIMQRRPDQRDKCVNETIFRKNSQNMMSNLLKTTENNYNQLTDLRLGNYHPLSFISSFVLAIL
jgi:hypothetical protein